MISSCTFASARWPSTRARTFFFLIFFPWSFSLHGSVDSCPDFLQFQALLCGVEPRWKTNCQRQCRPNHQDLGLAIWRLPVDADRALEFVSFFQVFLLVSVDSCADFSQLQCLFSGVEPRWKANCQRQSWQNHQDLGLAIWRLPVDPDRALELVRFFHDYAKEK